MTSVGACWLLKSLARGATTRLCRPQSSRSYVLRRHQHTASGESRLPRIAQPSIWHSIIPRPLRGRSASAEGKKKPTNPATYFLWIYLLIGSQAIRIMGIQNDFTTFMRRADLKIEALRQVVEKLQRGEEVDVEKVLGTGDEVQEQEWEEALRELQEEDRVWQANARKRREEQERLAREEQDANPVNESLDKAQGNNATHLAPQPVRRSRPAFY
ncbi:hypothetical protein EDD37DRAFT_622329 [Exophiala viscosa]|uniref:Uncharacterized protein n=1 Tax=Exophiala viscosa TaxID=2486360 RepID=A0AAN6E772_9EURO|nr:hypothetical protein EDD36DRAFT_426124 [Exophiala viscosa]KAI1627448.1 hypothetical protein EDD37DRAFT_622329 [Exophiala viscosa]